MIRIYDKEEKSFDNLGLGSLDEAITAVVVEELNGGYEMEMEYPITGRHFDKIQHRNIIFCKPNMYSDPQPFRIYSITKPINGIVVINAEHISYDANGVTILPKRDSETKTIESFGDKVTVDDKEGYYLDTILRDINLASAIQDKNRFTITRGSNKENVFKEDGYKIPAPINLRSMLGGTSGSLLEQFKGEYEFDKYNIILHNKRGINRGITIRYGKNMTDLEHESEGNSLYTAIFPFYSKSYTETQTSTKPVFQETYIIKGVTPLRADWLSIELIDVSKGIGGVSLKPVVEFMKVLVDGVENLVERYAPVIVKTPDDPEGTDEFYNKIYVFKRNKVDTENPELTNLFEVYVSQKHIETKIINEEEKTVEVIDEIKLSEDEDADAIVPEFGNIYVVKSENSEHYNRNIIWDNGQFMEYSSDGFYVEAKDATAVPESKKLPTPIPTYPISWDEDNETWVKDIQNGSIYVEPKMPHVGTISVDKYVYLDLLEYALPDGSTTLLENGVIYVNEELKNLDNQKVLTLDMTESLDSIGGLEPTQMTQEHLFDKAEQYLKDNDLTKMKESVKISFIKLSDSPEYAHLKQLEIVELGDEINVIYEDLGVNSKHRVISTEYNVLTDSYNEIELGDKVSKITNNVVSVGDNISSLKNDEEFANKTYVVDFVAENAKIINAEIQNAIINTLEAAYVNISNSLTASSAAIDQLVAEMLVSENAKISELLEAGSVRVRGKITALSGEIGGSKIEDGKLIVSTSISIEGDDGTKFIVNEDGEVTANKLTITGGSIAIGKDSEFYDVFKVDENGKMTAKDADIEGSVKIKEGSILIGGYEDNPNFEVTNDGKMTAKDADIEGNVTIKQGSIKIGGTEENPNFEVTNYGKMTAKGVTIQQGEIVIGDTFVEKYAYIRSGTTEYSSVWLSLTEGGEALTPDANTVYYILTEGDHWFKVYKWNGSEYILYERKYFSVDEYGNVVIGSGSININNNFMVDSNGNVNIEGGKINIYDPVTGSGFKVTEGANVQISGLASININKDAFEVTEDGDVTASHITSDGIRATDINSDKAVIDNLTVGSIKFGEDGSMELRRESTSVSESQTLNFRAHVTNSFNQFTITVSETNGKRLWYDRDFNVGFTYSTINGVRYSASATIKIENGEYTGSNTIIIGGGEFVAFDGTASVFPKRLTEVRHIGDDNKLVLYVNNTSYDIAGESTENGYVGLRVFLREDQPLLEEVSDGDFWYDID